jgi:hypothetical protein
LITLTFRPVHGESPVLVRGMHFRICADATLRGPDNVIAASYSDGLWRLGRRQHRAFDCAGPVYLRVTNSDGSHERLGPYDFIKAAEGAIFTQDSCLGIYASRVEGGASIGLWREITFLSKV